MKKLIIITADHSLPKWGSLFFKLEEIKETLETMKNAEFDIEIEVRDLVPEVRDGRITHAWMDTLSIPLFNQGYDFVVLHMSEAQKNEWGISGIRGAYQVDNDDVSEAYIWADEHTKRGDTRLNQFVETMLHELSHAYCRTTGSYDHTHTWHKTYKTIKGIFKLYDMAKYQPLRSNLKKQLSLLQRVVALLFQKQTPTYVNRLQPVVERKANQIVRSMEALGHPVRIVEGYRTMERQTELYNQGRTTPGNKVTNAKAGESFHNYGVAVDFVFRKEGYNASVEQWKTLGTVGKLLGFEWGGDWKGFTDKPHFELPLGYTVKDFQAGRVDYSKFI